MPETRLTKISVQTENATVLGFVPLYMPHERTVIGMHHASGMIAQHIDTVDMMQKINEIKRSI